MNALYPLFKQELLKGTVGTALTNNFKVALVGGYIYSSTHQFWSSVASNVVGTPVSLAGVTMVNGIVKASSPITFLTVGGNQITSIVYYLDSGVSGSSSLVYYEDTGVVGLPITPNGSNISLALDSSMIFTL